MSVVFVRQATNMIHQSVFLQEHQLQMRDALATNAVLVIDGKPRAAVVIFEKIVGRDVYMEGVRIVHNQAVVDGEQEIEPGFSGRKSSANSALNSTGKCDIEISGSPTITIDRSAAKRLWH